MILRKKFIDAAMVRHNSMAQSQDPVERLAAVYVAMAGLSGDLKRDITTADIDRHSIKIAMAMQPRAGEIADRTRTALMEIHKSVYDPKPR